MELDAIGSADRIQPTTPPGTEEGSMKRTTLALVVLLGSCSILRTDYSKMSTEELEDIVDEPEPYCPAQPYGCPDPPLYPKGGAADQVCLSWQRCVIDQGGWSLRTHEAATEL